MSQSPELSTSPLSESVFPKGFDYAFYRLIRRESSEQLFRLLNSRFAPRILKITDTLNLLPPEFSYYTSDPADYHDSPATTSTTLIASWPDHKIHFRLTDSADLNKQKLSQIITYKNLEVHDRTLGLFSRPPNLVERVTESIGKAIYPGSRITPHLARLQFNSKGIPNLTFELIIPHESGLHNLVTVPLGTDNFWPKFDRALRHLIISLSNTNHPHPQASLEDTQPTHFSNNGNSPEPRPKLYLPAPRHPLKHPAPSTKTLITPPPNGHEPPEPKYLSNSHLQLRLDILQHQVESEENRLHPTDDLSKADALIQAVKSISLKPSRNHKKPASSAGS